MPASHPPATAPSEVPPSALGLGAEDEPLWGDESAVFDLRGSRPPPFGALDYVRTPDAALGSLAPLDGFDSLPPLDAFDSLVPLDAFDSLVPLDAFDSLAPPDGSVPLEDATRLGEQDAPDGVTISGDVGQLFSSYRAYVAKIGRRILGPTSEVDDLIQDVFLATVRDVHKVKDPARLRAWLATVTTRMAKRRRFRSSTHPISSDSLDALDEVASDAGPGPESTAELSGSIRKLLSLPDELRTPWLLKHVEGHTLEDVAKRCDCSLSTAARRIQTVSDKLLRRR
jgi:RNA polymerase sigma-70 factor, ECF subfamily